MWRNSLLSLAFGLCLGIAIIGGFYLVKYGSYWALYESQVKEEIQKEVSYWCLTENQTDFFQSSPMHAKTGGATERSVTGFEPQGRSYRSRSSILPPSATN